MKFNSIILTAVAVLGAASMSSAALYTFKNAGTDATTYGVTDMTGVALTGNAPVGYARGIIQLGTFNLDDATLAISDQTAIVGAFSGFGSVSNFSNRQAPASLTGQFNITTANVPITGNATFENKPMYAMIANADTFNNATEFLIWNLGRAFQGADDGSPTGVPLGTVDATYGAAPKLVLGGFDNFQIGTDGNDPTPTPSFNTVVPVPEASSALLGLLGLAGLIRRRR